MSPKLLIGRKTKIVLTTVIAAIVFAGCEANTSKLDPKNRKQTTTTPSLLNASPSPSPINSSSPAPSSVTPNEALAGTWSCIDKLSDTGACGTDDSITIANDLKTMTQEENDLELKASTNLSFPNPKCDITQKSDLTYNSIDKKGVISVTLFPGDYKIQDSSQDKSTCQSSAMVLSQRGLPNVNLSLSISDYKTANDKLIIDANDGSPKKTVRKIYIRDEQTDASARVSIKQ